MAGVFSQLGSLFGRVGSFLGLLSLLSLLLGVLSFIAAGLVYLFLPELRASLWSLLALGGLFILLFLLGAFNQMKIAFLGRRGKYGANTVVLLLVFLGIMGLLNFIAVQNRQRFDVTALGQFTLTPQTVRVLKELPGPVKVTAFFVPNDPAGDKARSLLNEYTFHTRLFTFDFVDPEANPGVARQYGIKYYGAMVFESGARRRSVSEVDEQVFSGAILEVTGVKQKKVYFLTGHDERDLATTTGEGYSQVKEGLVKDLYQMDTLSLAVTPEVPQDAAALVIAAPRKPFAEKEVKALEDYLDRGGKLFILADPRHSPELDPFLARWGLTLGKGIIIDEASFVSPDTATPVVLRGQYLPSVVTEGVDVSYFPEATSVTAAEKAPKTVALFPLALTSSRSWLETGEGERKFDEGKDTRGPLALGALLVGSLPKEGGETRPPARLVVMGDSDFASNQHFYSGGNSDLFLNAVSWLVEEEKLIGIRPKPLVFRRLVLGPAEERFVLYSSMGFLPLAVILGAFVAWWRRR